MKAHPIAKRYPLLEGEAFDALVADIKEHGQKLPIVVFDGMILDGRNRWRACKAAGVEPKTTEMKRGESPTDLVISLNRHRRHLSPVQLAADAASPEVLESFKQEAETRQRAGTTSDGAGGRGRKKPSGHSTRKVSEATQAAARAFGAGESAVKAMASIQRAAPEVYEAARDGSIGTVADAKRIAKLPESERTAAVRAVRAGSKASDAIRNVKRETVKASLEDVSAREAKAAAGVYDVIVLDPPWPMEKIERDERPNQVAFDYPTMSEAELAAIPVPCADDCHVWVWTTQKFLPMALRLLDAWGLKYVCTFVWHKPGGPQPFDLPQYNCEFALYARKGAPKFLDTKAFFTCFEAPRGKHSAKPEEFYDVVRRVTAGRRLDMFNRRSIAGFDGWGKEAANAAE